MDGRGLECARGKVIGGSSSINAMAYVRGHRGDYDRWAASGLHGMVLCPCAALFPPPGILAGRRELLPRRRWPADDADGAITPIRWSMPSRRPAATPAIRSTPDYNGARQEGFGVWQMTVRDGRRCSAADAYLRPALARRNLTRRGPDALATRLIIEGNRAVGVEYLRGGRTMTARASREVDAVRRRHQLAAAPDALRHRRPRRSCARSASRSRWRCAGSARICRTTSRRASSTSARSPARCTGAMRLDRIVPALAAAHFRGTGIATGLPAGMMAFLEDAAEMPPCPTSSFSSTPRR